MEFQLRNPLFTCSQIHSDTKTRVTIETLILHYKVSFLLKLIIKLVRKKHRINYVCLGSGLSHMTNSLCKAQWNLVIIILFLKKRACRILSLEIFRKFLFLPLYHCCKTQAVNKNSNYFSQTNGFILNV